MSQPAVHPLVQAVAEVYNVARLANVSADVHDRCRSLAEQAAAFIADATKPAEIAPDAPIPGPGSTG